MKRHPALSLLIITVITAAIPLVSFAVASQGTPQLPNSPIQSPGDVVTIAQNIVVWLYTIFFIAAVGFILWAAFLYLTARDDATKVAKAKASLKNAVIAIIIALVASGASLLIQNVIEKLKSG